MNVLLRKFKVEDGGNNQSGVNDSTEYHSEEIERSLDNESTARQFGKSGELFCADFKEMTNEGQRTCSCKALLCGRVENTCVYQSPLYGMQLACHLKKPDHDIDVFNLTKDDCACTFKFI